METIVIGGGTGFIGASIKLFLEAKGYNVVTISRKPGPGTITWEDVNSNGLPKGTLAVIHTAGESISKLTRMWTQKYKDEILNSRIQTTKILANAISSMNKLDRPKVFILISAIGYYPHQTDKVYTEEDVTDSEDFLQKLVSVWEDAAKFPKYCRNTRTVIIRAGIVLGSTGGIMRELSWLFYLCLGGPIAGGDQSFPWIHVDDLASLILFCIDDPKTKGILNGVAPQLCTNTMFSNALAEAMNRPAIIPFPEWAVKLWGAERAKMLTHCPFVKPQKALEFGFVFKYDNISDACNQIVSG